MEIELKRSTAKAFKLLEKSESSCDISTEIVVPDTQEDILRILFTSPVLKIRAKDIEPGAVNIKGELELNIIYVTESEDKISTLHSALPFEKRFEVNGADSDCTSCAGLRLTAIDTRALNPRKVLIKAEVTVSQSCYCKDEIIWYEKPEEIPAKVFFKERNQKIGYINFAAEKTFSLEEEYSLNSPVDSASVVGSEVRYFADSADRVGNKMIIKGHADIGLLYLKDENILENANFSVFFSQLFDVPDGDDIPQYSISILSTGEYFEISENKVFCDMHAVAQLVCTDELEIAYVEDMYACGMNLNVEEERLENSRYIESDYRYNAQTVYEAESSVDRILYFVSRAGKISKSSEDAVIPITTDALFLSDRMLKSCRIRCEVKLDGELYPENMFIDTNVIPSGSNIEVRINIHGTAKNNESSNLSIISSATVEECEKNTAMPSVYLFRAENNDLWSVAKKYRSDINCIMSINNLEKADDAVGKMLLIPRIK